MQFQEMLIGAYLNVLNKHNLQCRAEELSDYLNNNKEKIESNYRKWSSIQPFLFNPTDALSSFIEDELISFELITEKMIHLPEDDIQCTRDEIISDINECSLSGDCLMP